MHVDPRHRSAVGRSTLREQRTDDAGKHVACSGGGERRVRERAQRAPSVGPRDDRVRSLEHDNPAPRCRCLAGGGHAVRLQLANGLRQQPRHLARVRRQDRRRGEVLRPPVRPGQSVQGVGVHDDGDVLGRVRQQQLLEEAPDAFGVAKSGADDRCGRAGQRLPDRPPGFFRYVTVRGLGQRQVHLLQELPRRQAVHALGRGERDEARAGPIGACRREYRRADEAARPRNDDHVPEAPFVRVDGPRGQQAADQGGVRKLQLDVCVRPAGETDAYDLQSTHVGGAREAEHPGFRRPEGERDVGREAEVVARARVRVDAGGEVHGEELGPGRFATQSLYQPDHAAKLAFERALAADPQHGVDHGVGQLQVATELPLLGVLGRFDDPDAACPAVLELVVAPAGRGHVERDEASPVRQVPRGHHAVPAVVSGAHEHDDPAPTDAVEDLGHGPGYSEARRLHERVFRRARLDGATLQRPHLLDGDDFHASRPMTEATA